MNIKLLFFFIVLNIVNVALQTIKSLLTNKGTKWTAAISNAVAFGLYTVLLVYMTCELSLWTKVIVVSFCNLVAVYIVKWGEEKLQKDRLWKIELTVYWQDKDALDRDLHGYNISHNYIEVGKWAVFNCYCPTKAHSTTVHQLAKKYNAKYFLAN